MNRRPRVPAALLVALVLTSCTESPVPAGQIMALNDSQDSEYNVIQVSGHGKRYTLAPGEEGLFPKGTTSLSWSRKYKDYTRYYQVRCPSSLEKGIRIKLIDVHLNRIAGGCETIDAGKR